MNENKETVTAPQRRSPLFGIGLAIFFAVTAFFSGLQIGEQSDQKLNVASLFSATTASEHADLTEFWKVWQILDDKFVSSSSTESVTDEKKLQGAIAGLVASYKDPYTVFFPPADAEIFADDISGNFEGVGMEVGMRDNAITVIAPLPESPAKKAGIRSGDIIVKIDGKTTETMSVDEAVKNIRGAKGTTVAFTLLREGEEEFIEISVIRDTIHIPTIATEEKDGAYIIHLYNFSAVSEMKMQEALRSFLRSGDKKLILDVRGNPGGYLESAVGIASYFLPAGKVIVRESFGEGKNEQVHRSFGRNLFEHRTFKMVVLIDQGSASASEILAGALQEHGVATLIGQQSFGKGSVQELVELDDGSSLKVTIARWLTPNGISISHNGLKPDQTVEFTAEDRKTGKDPQLDAALKFLRK